MAVEPTRADLANDEVAIDIEPDLRDDGRTLLTAYWADGPDCMQAQAFCVPLAEFVVRTTANGKWVTALNERTHKILDSLEIES